MSRLMLARIGECIRSIWQPKLSPHRVSISTIQGERPGECSRVDSPPWPTSADAGGGQVLPVMATANYPELLLLNPCCCSVAKLCPTLCDPTDCSTRGLPVLHHLAEFAQTHVHRVGDTIQPSHPMSFPSPPALNPSQHQSLFR